jgi:deazaflavin-dependent oxidoreductase (nitroreductase family)
VRWGHLARRGVRRPLVFWVGHVNPWSGWRGSRLHTLVYRALRGRLVGSMQGHRIVLLTTTGRRSGKPRTTPITVLVEPRGYLAIASYRPAWLANLRAEPSAEILDRGRRTRVLGTVCDDPEARERFRAFYPALTSIEEKAQAEGRTVPLLRFSPADGRVPYARGSAGSPRAPRWSRAR